MRLSRVIFIGDEESSSSKQNKGYLPILLKVKCVSGRALLLGQRPNELWCTDYQGEFLLGNRQYCYPLTVTDHASRFLLSCEALSSTKENYAFVAFERLFKERGLPANIRSDNGVPFASAHALFNLSKLAVWWVRLGVGIERIQPGHPQQNGRHERMHLTLKKK
jgi:transposase InsO family protein